MAAPATEGVIKTWRTGLKQVFLPSHTVTFLAPRKTTPPTFATFKVPLTFNKFDIRDYLLHVYQTPVLAVRSQVRSQPVQRSKASGHIYRPPPIKTMTVQLAKPFVWPRAPTDVKPWKSISRAKMMKEEEENKRRQESMEKYGYLAPRDEVKPSEARNKLREEAKRLLKEGGWDNKRNLDPRFSK